MSIPASQYKTVIDRFRSRGAEPPAELLERYKDALEQERQEQADTQERLRREIENIRNWDPHAASARVIGSTQDSAERTYAQWVEHLSKVNRDAKAAPQGAKYTFDASGAPLARCEDRRCNARVYVRDLVLRKEMLRIPLPGVEDLWKASTPLEQESLPHRQIAVDVSICANCAAERDAKGGRTYVVSPAGEHGVLDTAAPPAELKEFWKTRYGRSKVEASDVVSPGVAGEFFYRTVRRQG